MLSNDVKKVAAITAQNPLATFSCRVREYGYARSLPEYRTAICVVDSNGQ